MTYTSQPRPDAPLPQVAHRPRLQAAMARLYAQITQPDGHAITTVGLSAVVHCQHQLLWNPEDVHRRLDVVTGQRWRRPWTPDDGSPKRPPLIDETDASGVDRRLIATWVSPDVLRMLERRTRQRVRAHHGHVDASMPPFVYLLLETLQAWVLRQTTSTPAQAAMPSDAAHPWTVGDVVLYAREVYRIDRITAHLLSLCSDRSGEFDLPHAAASRALTLVAPALRVVNP